jgi:REP element-mobilizing transposase RayT
MGHTFTNLLAHMIFSTKDRRPLITAELKSDLFAYMGGIVRQLGGTALLVNGMPDHVHMLILMPATASAAELVNKVKTNSSKWVHEVRKVSDFAWQTGYSAFAVSESNRGSVLRYISDQEQHHAKHTFQEELVAYLKKHGISYNEQYIWS